MKKSNQKISASRASEAGPSVVKVVGRIGEKTRTIKIRFSKAAIEKAYQRAVTCGDVQIRRVSANAERACPGFTWKAKQIVLRILKTAKRASSEDLTDAVKSCGLVPHDDRAFGAVYAGLYRAGLIRVVDSCARRKGRGTSGGRVWALVS